MKRIYKVKPTKIEGVVELVADDTRIKMDRKTKDAVRDENQQPIVEELHTQTVQKGESVGLEYPHFPRSTHVVLPTPSLKEEEVWLVDAHEAIHSLLEEDPRCESLTWKEANSLVRNLIEFVLPGDVE